MLTPKERIINFILDLPDDISKEEIVMAIIVADLREMGVLRDYPASGEPGPATPPKKKKGH